MDTNNNDNDSNILIILLSITMLIILISLLLYFKIINIDQIINNYNNLFNINNNITQANNNITQTNDNIIGIAVGSTPGFDYNSRKNKANALILSISTLELRLYDLYFDKESIVNEYGQNYLNRILYQKDTIEEISNKLSSDELILLGYDKFVENIISNGLDHISESTGTINNVINNMKIIANDEYNKLYNQRDISFPSVIGPLNKEIDIEILKKIILEFINNNIKNFINEFNTKILTNANYNNFIDNYIFDQNYNEETLKSFTKELIINEYDLNILNIKSLLIENYVNIIKLLCTKLRSNFVHNTCTYDVNDCNNMYSSNNIYTKYTNGKCLTSSNSVLQKYVDTNVSNNDITYDNNNEKVKITSEYCIKKGLEETTDLEGNIDCKFKKEKPMLESAFGTSLLDIINKKYNTNDYEKCNYNEIDGVNTNIIPDDLKQLIEPITKKYGPIEKSLCFNKNYACPLDKELVNGFCYNKCPDGYSENPDNKNECYKLYPYFENDAELKNANFFTRKTIINDNILPQNICENGYYYNDVEKKCIQNPPDGYTLTLYDNNNYLKDYPVKWDGILFHDKIIKNALLIETKDKVLKCLDADKPELINDKCYAYCPDGHERIPGNPGTCVPEPCPEGYNKTDQNNCYRSAATKIAWYTKGPAIERWKCPTNYTNIAGVCWANSCPDGWWSSSPGICVQNCPGIPGMSDYTYNGGICWKCPEGYPDALGVKDAGGVCRKQCDAGYTNLLGAGICWKNSCPDGWWSNSPGLCTENCPPGYQWGGGICYKSCKPGDLAENKLGEGTKPEIEVGALCREPCPPGHRDIAAVCYPDCPLDKRDDGTSCWVDIHTYNRKLTCPAGYTMQGLDCYKDGCPSDYQELEFSCTRGSDTIWKDKANMWYGECPSDYSKLLTTCSRGPDTIWKDRANMWYGDCPSDYITHATTCSRIASTYNKDSYRRVRGKGCCEHWWGYWRCVNECPKGPGLWESNCMCGEYDCKPGYTEYVKEICTQEGCPDGYGESGIGTCYRGPHDYNRDMLCPADYERKGLYCYKKGCPAGYDATEFGSCQRNVHTIWKDKKGVTKETCEPYYNTYDFTCTKGAHAEAKKMVYPKTEIRHTIVPKVEKLHSYTLDTKVKDNVRPQVEEIDKTPALCPSDRDTLDGFCYPKCTHDYYSSSPSTCETNTCPDNFEKTEAATCQISAHTITNPQVGVGEPTLVCPEGTQEVLPEGKCYSNNNPEGYERNSISIDKWTEKCPNDWPDSEQFCTRPTKPVVKVDATCPIGYTTSNNKCFKKSNCQSFESINDKCVEKCPLDTVNNTDTTCGRKKIIINKEEKTIPYKYRLKKRIV